MKTRSLFAVLTAIAILCSSAAVAQTGAPKDAQKMKAVPSGAQTQTERSNISKKDSETRNNAVRNMRN